MFAIWAWANAMSRASEIGGPLDRPGRSGWASWRAIPGRSVAWLGGPGPGSPGRCRGPKAAEGGVVIGWVLSWRLPRLIAPESSRPTSTLGSKTGRGYPEPCWAAESGAP